MSNVTEKIVDLIRNRSEIGLKKYGVSMDRVDLSTDEWIQHAIEEMLDGAQYLYKLKQEIKKLVDKAYEEGYSNGYSDKAADE